MSLAVGTSAAATGAPNAPTGLTASDIGAGVIQLSWSAPSSGPAPLGYEIVDGTASGQEGTALNPNVLVTGTSTKVNVAVGATDFFEVVAVNAAGVSGNSNEATATANQITPYGPTGLTATPGNGFVTLNWTAPANWGDTQPASTAVESYQVLASTTSGAEVAVGAPITGSATAAPATTATETIANGTKEYFKVEAIDTYTTSMTSYQSNEASATPGVTVPDAPTLLGVVANSITDTTAELSWTPPANDGGSAITGYDVYEGTSSGGESSSPVNGTSVVTGTTLTVGSLTFGTTYYFTVKAVNAQGQSVASAETTVLAGNGHPAPPTGLKATGGYGTIHLAWTAASSGAAATGYNVYESTTAGGENLAGVPVNGGTPLTTTSDDVTVAPATGQTEYFVVEAVNASGSSDPSAEASATTQNTAPGAPIDVYGTNTLSSETINWTPPVNAGDAGGVTGYNVYESGTAAPVCNAVAASPCTVTLAGAGPYTFYVVAGNGVGIGATPSASISVTPDHNAPAAPTGLAGTGTSGTSVSLTWNAPGDQGGTAVTAYTVLINGSTTYPAGVTVPAATVTAGGGSDTVTGLTPGTSYSFSVEATNGSVPGTSPASSAVSVTPSTTPDWTGNTGTILTGNPAGTTSALLSWQTPVDTGGSPITGYDVYEGTTEIASGDLSTYYYVNGLTDGTAYSFTVRAVNANGQSIDSNAVSVTPGPVPPSPPTALSASASGSVTTLNWTAPNSDGGDPIQYYAIYEDTNQFAQPALDTGATAHQLTLGTQLANVVPAGTTTATIIGLPVLPAGESYYYQVVAFNAAGHSVGSNVANSAQTSGTAPAAPNAPFAVDAGAGAVKVNWTAPTDNGSSAITGYVLTTYLNGAAVSSKAESGLSDTVTGLTAGAQYTFTVAAVNAVGTSAQSSFSNPVTVAGASGPSTAQKNSSDKKWATASAQHLVAVNLSKLAKGRGTVQSYAGLGGGKTSESLYVKVGKKKTLVATGSHTFSKIGHVTLKLKLTKAGKKLMKSLTSAKKKATVTVTGKVVSTPKGLTKQTVTKSKRRKA